MAMIFLCLGRGGLEGKMGRLLKDGLGWVKVWVVRWRVGWVGGCVCGTVRTVSGWRAFSAGQVGVLEVVVVEAGPLTGAEVSGPP